MYHGPFSTQLKNTSSSVDARPTFCILLEHIRLFNMLELVLVSVL